MPTRSQNKWKTNEPPTKDENEDNSIVAAYFSHQQFHDSPIYRFELAFSFFSHLYTVQSFWALSLLLKPRFCPFIGTHPCQLGPSVFHLQSLIPPVPDIRTSSNATFSSSLLGQELNSTLGVNIDYLYEVCLYIQAQTHREYIKAHLNAVWYFRRLSQGEK